MRLRSPGQVQADPEKTKPRVRGFVIESGAGEGIRTLDPDLGKVVLYH